MTLFFFFMFQKILVLHEPTNLFQLLSTLTNRVYKYYKYYQLRYDSLTLSGSRIRESARSQLFLNDVRAEIILSRIKCKDIKKNFRLIITRIIRKETLQRIVIRSTQLVSSCSLGTPRLAYSKSPPFLLRHFNSHHPTNVNRVQKFSTIEHQCCQYPCKLHHIMQKHFLTRFNFLFQYFLLPSSFSLFVSRVCTFSASCFTRKSILSHCMSVCALR